MIERLTKKLRVERARVYQASTVIRGREREEDNSEGKTIPLGICIRNYPE